MENQTTRTLILSVLLTFYCDLVLYSFYSLVIIIYPYIFLLEKRCSEKSIISYTFYTNLTLFALLVSLLFR